ncbi:MAG: radical SAM protein [Erysipelotrichaceae bacterium]|nr:radical SAM protein [Erysipelotrichaceae bacterium]
MIKRIYLEITNACNLDCPFCTNSKGQSFMSLEEIDEYTSQIKEICDYIYLHVLGEPTLHPHVNEILDILDKKDLKLQLVTNGTLLYKYPDILKHKCLRKLSVSLHSINNLDIEEKYYETINKLIEENTDCAIEIRFYDYDNLELKLKNYLNTLQSKYSFDLTSKQRSYRLKDKVYIYFENFFKWPDMSDEYVGNKGRCQGIKSQIAILHNGDVTSCCLDPYGVNAFGNLKKECLKDILNNEKYLNALNDLRNNKLNLPLCQKCTYHLRFDRND